MQVNDSGSTRSTSGAGGSGQSSAAADAEKAARDAQRAAEEAARAAAEAARAQAAQAAQAQARAEAAAKRAQDALKQAQAALAEARKQNAPRAELARAETAVATASTAAQQAAASARSAGSRASTASSFVPARAPTGQPTTAARPQPPAGPPAPAARPQAPAGPPGVTPGYTQAQAAKDATELYRAMKGGLTGWGTDEAAIFRTLQGKSPADINLIRQSFREHYKLDLDATIRDELSGTDLTRANNMLAGNRGNAGAAAIRQQTEGWFGDKDAVIKTLQEAPPAERLAIARSFQQMYAGEYRHIKASSPEEFMRKALEPSLSDAQKTQLRSLLATTQASTPQQVNQLEAQAARTKVHDALQGFFGADSQKVFDTIQGLPPEQKKLLLQDASLQAELQKKLSREDYTRARGLLEGNTAAASAAQINSATQGWFGADKSAILDVLKNTKPEDLGALKAEFQKQTGRSLESVVRGWGGSDAQVGLSYLNPPTDAAGQARADAQRLYRAMDGVGTDEAALREVLGSRSKAQIDEIAKAYRQLYNGADLRSDLVSELGGRDKFEIVDQMFDKGAIDPNAPDAAQQQLQRLREQQRFEQSGGLGVINTIQNLTKGESDAARLERNLTDAETALSTGNTDAANRRLGYATDDVKDVQETKDSTADMAATAAVAVVTTAAVVATGGAATPLAIAGYAALGAGTRMATQAYFKGDSLGTDGLLHQGALGAVEGGTAVIPLPKGLGGAGNAVVTETAEQAAKVTLGQRLRTTAIQGAWEGGLGGAASGGLDQAMQSETWRNGLANGLSQVGQRALFDGTVGSAFGAGGGVAMDGVMAGTSRLMAPRDVPVLRNPTLEGGTVRVRYDDGRVRIEAGPKATDAQIRAHLETAQTLQKYEGPLGQVRQLKDRAMQALTGRPGYGTQGFESQLEVKKLKALISELEGVQKKIDARLHSADGGELPTPAQRADMERELAGLRTQLATHQQLVNSLDPARGFVAAQELSKGATEAKRLGYPDAPEDHVWRLRDGTLELVNRGDGARQMYVPSGQEPQVKGSFVDAPTTKVEPKFADNTTPADAFEALGGTDPKSSFGAWVKMMKDEGLVPNDQALISAMHQTPDGLTFRTVRHELKQQYVDKVMERITDPARLQTTPAYQQALKATNDPQQALKAASHVEMLRLTSGLSSSDKGAIAERWYMDTFGKARGAQNQVSISRADAAKQGVTLNEDRRIDIMENGTLRELKNVSTPFGPREHGQVADLLKLINKQVDVKGNPQQVSSIVETFLDPRGAVANARWMHETLDPDLNNPIKFEVFKADGSSVVLDSTNRDILADPKKLAQFLGLEK